MLKITTFFQIKEICYYVDSLRGYFIQGIVLVLIKNFTANQMFILLNQNMNVYRNHGSAMVMSLVQMEKMKARNYAEWKKKNATKENSGLFRLKSG